VISQNKYLISKLLVGFVFHLWTKLWSDLYLKWLPKNKEICIENDVFPV